MLSIREGSRVKIIRPGAFHGHCGVVIEAEEDRQVANILLDEKNVILPPPYGAVETVEEDYECLEVIGESAH